MQNVQSNSLCHVSFNYFENFQNKTCAIQFHIQTLYYSVTLKDYDMYWIYAKYISVQKCIRTTVFGIYCTAL